MNKIMQGLSILVLMLTLAGVTAAYDSDNPYTNTIQWIIPSDTSFTVTFSGSETSIDFDDNVTGQTGDMIEPDGQNSAASTPIIVVNNTGNVNQDFAFNLTTAKPTWVTSLKVGNTSSYGSATEVNTEAVTFATAISPAHETDLYVWCNISNAAQGTTSRTFMISSSVNE